jgi:hypothetical protein
MAAPPDTTLSGRPIASLTFAINYTLARGDPHDLWGYHAVNLAIHILAALVLFGIVRRTLVTIRMRKRFGEAAPGAGVRDRARLARASAADRVRDLPRATRRVADGAVLSADALLRDPCRGSRSG